MEVRLVETPLAAEAPLEVTPLVARPAETPLEERPERLMKAPGMMAPGMIIQETGLVARTDPGLTTTATIAQTSGRTLGLKEIGPTQTVSELTKPAAISVVVTGLPGMTLMDPALM